ncbi:hypothetical protein [Neptunitalea lumnitzerae]|uniref:Uncharacterized protein n=1 Tax=Neptunitalea lumnitzerae TaxID=2965509 RepID=A0ABQ5MLZ7_9FLAO|nr:hypothetical protein [Neptunitalea sp. Y10]GLB50443.1 hypothetical protein Y10_28110 [Neptunitalea sp. Y10]
MSNTINVTKCDNEVIFVAYQYGASFELARIISGNSNPVDVTLNIEAGAYQGMPFFNGISNALKSEQSLNLGSGDYNLVAIGINWGGPQEFSFDFNGKNYSLPLDSNPSPASGVVWSTEAIPFSV